MKILLVKPYNSGDHIQPSLGLGYLATAVRENNEVQILDCIKERRDPVAHAEAGHRSATICHLSNIVRWVSEITGETGQRLKWDARNEQFTNSPEGNRFLDTPRRKGYGLPDQV